MFQNLIEKAYAGTSNLPVQLGSVPNTSGSSASANHYLQKILTEIVNPLVTLMIAIAVIYFLWGVFQFIRNAESSEERKKGGMHMLWGAIGLFIMVSAYGIINLILGTINPN